MIERRVIKPDADGNISEADLEWIGADDITLKCSACPETNGPFFAFWGDAAQEPYCADCLIEAWLDNSEGLDELT